MHVQGDRSKHTFRTGYFIINLNAVGRDLSGLLVVNQLLKDVAAIV